MPYFNTIYSFGILQTPHSYFNTERIIIMLINLYLLFDKDVCVVSEVFRRLTCCMQISFCDKYKHSFAAMTEKYVILNHAYVRPD
jgi:hypothetical protein